MIFIEDCRPTLKVDHSKASPEWAGSPAPTWAYDACAISITFKALAGGKIWK
jgi:hypothetical protein